MNTVPEFWRDEIWHPLSVHLPIALLLLASFIYLVFLVLKRDFWFQVTFLLLFVGVVGGWIAIYTGNLADGVVSRKICDPTVLKDHENQAYILIWLYSAALVFSSTYFTKYFDKFNALIKLITLLLLVSGSYFLINTGHLGAQLVYQQAAGVYVPSEDCNEFSE